MSASRVVLLTPGGVFTQRLRQALRQRGAAPVAWLVYPPERRAAGRGGALLGPLRALARRLRRRAEWAGGNGADTVAFTGPLNSPRMAEDLRRLRPEVLVLARCGLVGEALLSIPARGVVNVHPALLPWVRGNSPLAHSLLREVALGATAFRVDPGIDTGAVLARRLVPVAGGESAAELREGMMQLWVQMSAEVVVAAQAGTLAAGEAQTQRFPLCRTVTDPEQLAEVERRVAAGMPRALFERWSALCAGPELALPAGAQPEWMVPAQP
jgi:methionyl-tRNA formyltransferase